MKVPFKFIVFNIHGCKVLSDDECDEDESRFSLTLIYCENHNNASAFSLKDPPAS